MKDPDRLQTVHDQQSLDKKIRNYIQFGISDLFSSIDLETSSKCNRKCVYCPNSVHDRGTHFMSKSLFVSIINQLKELNFAGTIRPHYYNEPLLDKRLPDLLAYIHTTIPKVSIQVYSNGDYLTQSLFVKLINSGVSKIVITCHSGVVHKELKKLLKSPEGKKYIQLQFITKKTYLWNRGGTVTVDNVITLEKCSMPATTLVINYKGQVVLCCNDVFSKHVMGDLQKEKLIDIWKKEYFKKLRKEILSGKFNLDVCRECVSLHV